MSSYGRPIRSRLKEISTEIKWLLGYHIGVNRVGWSELTIEDVRQNDLEATCLGELISEEADVLIAKVE